MQIARKKFYDCIQEGSLWVHIIHYSKYPTFNGWQGSSGFVWVLWRNIKGSAHKLMKQVQTGGDNNMEGKQQSRGLEYSHVFLWTFATMSLMICGKLCSQKYKGNGINLNWEMVSWGKYKYWLFRNKTTKFGWLILCIAFIVFFCN